MNRFYILLLAMVWPITAFSFQPRILHIDGATIYSKRSLTQPCGADIEIALTNSDQRLVIIEYTYSGVFDSGTFNGVHTPGMNPPHLWTGSRSDVINVSMGRMTLNGLSLITFADPKGLYCLKDWSFNFIARSYNSTQAQRDEREQWRLKEEAKQAEINRRKQQELERKINAEKNMRDYKSSQIKAEQDRLAAYKNSSPENSRCIINNQADIFRCEQGNAREKANRQKQEAELIQKKKELEASQAAKARQEQQFRDSEEQYHRTKSDPCGAAAEVARRMPQLPQGAQTKSAAAQQDQIMAQWKQAKVAHDANCAAFRNQQQSFQQQPMQIQVEQQRRLDVQQKAEADLNVELQKGRGYVGEAANTTQKMQGENATLMDMINRMK